MRREPKRSGPQSETVEEKIRRLQKSLNVVVVTNADIKIVERSNRVRANNLSRLQRLLAEQAERDSAEQQELPTNLVPEDLLDSPDDSLIDFKERLEELRDDGAEQITLQLSDSPGDDESIDKINIEKLLRQINQLQAFCNQALLEVPAQETLRKKLRIALAKVGELIREVPDLASLSEGKLWSGGQTLDHYVLKCISNYLYDQLNK